MAEARTIDIAPRAIIKVLAAIALVWVWLQLWQLVTLVVVAAVLAIALDPLVDWLCRHGLGRSVGATAVVLLFTVVIVGFFLITGSSLSGQMHLLGTQLQDA